MQRTERNLETHRASEIKAKFAETEKIPYGEVLVSVFKNYTIPESWELKGGKIYGKASKEGEYDIYTPAMVLEACADENVASLRILDGREEPTSAYYTPDIKFGVDVSHIFRGVSVSLKERDFFLPSKYEYIKYHNWLVKVIVDVDSKLSQIPEEKIKRFEEKAKLLAKRGRAGYHIGDGGKDDEYG